MSVFNQSRSYIIRAIFLAVFLVILGQLVNLQIFSRKYHELARDNAVFAKIVYPERGIIFDRNGKPILNNTIMFDLMVTPAEVKNIDTVAFCKLMNIDTTEFRERIIEAIIKNSRVRPSIFISLLTPQMQARFEENNWRFSGFNLQARPVRTYPSNVGAQVLGYIGEVSPTEIERSSKYYRMGDYIGKNGLERTYESVLMGQRGVEYMIKDNKNRLVGHYENGEFDTTATAGRGLKTFIDVELQQLAEKLFTDKLGGVVAIDPKTGGILAMASGPTFNPNDLTGPDFRKNYGELQMLATRPLLNRAIKGEYPPGSTFKPIGGLIALDQGVITPSYGYACGGRYYGCGGGKPACTHSNAGHAANLRLATANSCNSYFTDIYRKVVDNPKYGSVKKGYAVWEEYMHNFGFGVRLGVDLPSEDNGNVTTVARYDKIYKNSWNSCTNLTLGIGQDQMLATPLQLANSVCIIANKGYYYTPHFVDSIENETIADTAFLSRYRKKHSVLTHISDTAYNAIIRGMEDVVLIGTARTAQIPGINVCAKTGTAQNFHRGKEQKEHSVFVCFAPKENPKIAIAIVVQNGGYGATWAGRMSRILMEQYLLDSLTDKSKADLESISKTKIIPAFIPREQYIMDSTSAAFYANLRKDSTNYWKYLRGDKPVKKDSSKVVTPLKTTKIPANKKVNERKEYWAITDNKKNIPKAANI
ncbi:penicillin-binding protein 2 [Niabella ginsengisoli]|uniref:Penicillin-binding protein 2 n=1 Tax=Niabella ginsengisoli TaxID=522298 RepID=A0ABS9SQB0_9BACT|nr:penicillin-binding protein 2 [Niabella ginsengisoli]MCH5600593.1 penicillin-binding protein 2 [Niabella ginsengisoli]